MRKVVKTISIMAVFLTTMLALAFTAGAGMGGFSASPNLPENQDPGSPGGFFDLWVTPGQTQEVTVDIHNHRENENITVEVRVFTAGTNMNGIIDYSRDALADDSIPFRFEDIARLPGGSEEITIPPRTTATVPLTITIPPGGFDGVVLGSFHILLGITQEERDAAGMIVNRFAQAIPVRMRVSDDPVEPDFYLGEVYTDLVAYRAAYILNVHHTAPRMSRDASVSTWIFMYDNQNTPIFAHEDMDVDFAPNTIFPKTLMDRAGYGIDPGDYLARVRIVYDGRVWEFDQRFTVAAQQAQEINTGAVNVQQRADTATGLSIAAIIAIVGGVLLLLLAILLLLKAKKKSQTDSATLEQLKGINQEDIAKLMAQMQQQQTNDNDQQDDQEKQ